MRDIVGLSKADLYNIAKQKRCAFAWIGRGAWCAKAATVLFLRRSFYGVIAQALRSHGGEVEPR